MNPKITAVWFLIAVGLLVLIFILQPSLPRRVAGPRPILYGLQPAAVTTLQNLYPDSSEICVERTKPGWQLVKPIHYPAAATEVGALLNALQSLRPVLRLDIGASNQISHAGAEYAFKNSRTLDVRQGANHWRLLVGHRTAPGDQVYVRIAGHKPIFVVDADWLKYIPHSADDWRDRALVDLNVQTFDWIIITNSPQAVELRCDPETHQWRMVRPLNTRANTERIADFLRRLQAAHVARFVADDPKADWEAYGLEPAHLDFWLGHGTNIMTALFLGMDTTKTAAEVFGRREGWNTVFTTAAPPLSYWWAPVNAFRDPYLCELTAPVTEIRAQGPDDFILRRQDANHWQVVGEKFPVDTGSVQQFIQRLARLRVSEFVKDVVTPPDLYRYGLSRPARQITLFAASHGTNIVTAQLFFGLEQTNRVFVRCAGDDSVYGITPEDFNRLPQAGWEFRQRRIWNFSNDDVSQITIRQNGKTQKIIHNGLDEWSLALGSQGIIVPPAIEETAYQLGQLYSAGWVAWNVTNAAPYGFRPNNLSLTVRLNNGKEFKLAFGRAIQSQTALAAVTLGGECWVFVFPPATYQLIQSYLTIPMDVL